MFLQQSGLQRLDLGPLRWFPADASARRGAGSEVIRAEATSAVGKMVTLW